MGHFSLFFLSPPHSTHSLLLPFPPPQICFLGKTTRSGIFKWYHFSTVKIELSGYMFNYYCFRGPYEQFSPHHSKVCEGSMYNCPFVDKVVWLYRHSRDLVTDGSASGSQCRAYSSICTSICQHKCVTILGLNLSIWRIIFRLVLKVKIKSVTHQDFFLFAIQFFLFFTRNKNYWTGELVMHFGS